MKVEHRIPTTTFGYISVYIEAGDELTPETIKELMADHARLLGAYNAPQAIPEGIPAKEMNMVVDKMLMGVTVEGGIEIYERMNVFEKYAVQTIKRALKRIEAKEDKPVIEK